MADFEALVSYSALSMERDFDNAVIDFALWRDPEHVAEVDCECEVPALSQGLISPRNSGAIDELLDELNGDGQPRH